MEEMNKTKFIEIIGYLLVLVVFNGHLFFTSQSVTTLEQSEINVRGSSSKITKKIALVLGSHPTVPSKLVEALNHEDYNVLRVQFLRDNFNNDTNDNDATSQESLAISLPDTTYLTDLMKNMQPDFVFLLLMDELDDRGWALDLIRSTLQATSNTKTKTIIAYASTAFDCPMLQDYFQTLLNNETISGLTLPEDLQKATFLDYPLFYGPGTDSFGLIHKMTESVLLHKYMQPRTLDCLVYLDDMIQDVLSIARQANSTMEKFQHRLQDDAHCGHSFSNTIDTLARLADANEQDTTNATSLDKHLANTMTHIQMSLDEDIPQGQKTCFITASFGHSLKNVDPVPNITWGHSTVYDRPDEFEFYAFTNLKDLETNGWTRVFVHHTFPNHIIGSRYPKFMAWKSKTIQSNCKTVFYMDGGLIPIASSDIWHDWSNQILNSPGGLAQLDLYHQQGPIKELNIIQGVGKDFKANVEKEKEFLFSRCDFDPLSAMYANQLFGYDPQNINFQIITGRFWSMYSLGLRTWRDQPLWSYIRHREASTSLSLGVWPLDVGNFTWQVGQGHNGHSYVNTTTGKAIDDQ